MNIDTVEYKVGTHTITILESSVVPPLGASVVVHGKVFKVEEVTYILLYPDAPYGKKMHVEVHLGE